jgi:hypothetical protein
MSRHLEFLMVLYILQRNSNVFVHVKSMSMSVSMYTLCPYPYPCPCLCSFSFLYSCKCSCNMNMTMNKWWAFHFYTVAVLLYFIAGRSDSLLLIHYPLLTVTDLLPLLFATVPGSSINSWDSWFIFNLRKINACYCMTYLVHGKR